MEQEEQTYLIPANAKRSGLILGYFTMVDLFIFGFGVLTTVIMLLVINSTEFKTLMMILAPALVSAFLVMPVPHYHNVLQLIINIVTFIFKQKSYKWKGWCVWYGDDTK
ncbi:MAG: hypothetical protein IJA94_03565 [Bacilli bacterium]|nr:hypothetical protein [Bacilli bacterium]